MRGMHDLARRWRVQAPASIHCCGHVRGEGNRTATYAIRMPVPATDLNLIVQPPLPAYLNFTYQAFDVAGDYVFAAELTGPVHVFAAATGGRVTVLNPGPEVSGFAWQDAHAGLHAFERDDGEYVIVTQNSGFRARNNLLRWRPPAAAPDARRTR